MRSRGYDHLLYVMYIEGRPLRDLPCGLSRPSSTNLGYTRQGAQNIPIQPKQATCRSCRPGPKPSGGAAVALLKTDGDPAAPAAIEFDGVETICVCFLEDVTEARIDFTNRKLARQSPSARIVVCLLGEPGETEDREGRPNVRAPRSLKSVLLVIEKYPVSALANKRQVLAGEK
jgi:hypothetical protein